jgi:hypothetical protein
VTRIEAWVRAVREAHRQASGSGTSPSSPLGVPALGMSATGRASNRFGLGVAPSRWRLHR